jgi:ATP-binding cassette, subfamily B, bacterial
MKPDFKTQVYAWQERLRSLKNLPATLELLWDSGPALAACTTGFRCAKALVPVSMLWVSKLIIETVVAASQGKSTSTGIWWLLAAEFLLAGAAALFGRIVDYCDVRLADQFSRNVTLKIMGHAEKLDVAAFEDPVFYDILERARLQATDRIAMLTAVGRLLEQAITLASLSTGIILYAPGLFLLLVACVLPAFLGESHFAFLGYALAHSLTPVRRELDYLRVLATSKESVKEVKVFGLAGYLRDRFSTVTDGLIARNRGLAKRRLTAGSALTLIGSFGYYAGYAFLVIRTMQGQITVGDLTFLGGALAASSTQIQAIFSTFSMIADQALFLGDLVHFFNVKPRIVSKPNALPAPRPIRAGFEFRNVSFHYPGSKRLILTGLDFRIEPGERVALVGENGRGKTTFVKLLARLYEPTDGRILLDGVDLRDYDVEELHKQIGIIFQDFMRYDLPARDNVAVGKIHSVANDREVMRAAAKSGAIDLIQRFPDGLDQMLGRRFEGGVDLSGGEWQKFALARAYMRDAQLIILDEPTAALDAMAEFEIFRRFSELTKGRMAVMISHRFSTVRMCDRIAVIEAGRIREQGSHGQLVASGGPYSRMFEMQAANYR